MENWTERVLLTIAACSLLATPVAAEKTTPMMQVVNPGIERREIDPPAIDTEDFEIGPYAGMLSIQDFDSEVVYGVRAAWHITEDFFFEANYGTSEGDLTSYEKLSGGAPLFEDADRDYTFYNLSLGWNALPGEIFLFDGRAMKSDFYLIGGAGNTDFLGDNWFTATLGVGYRLLINDAIALRLDVRDHIFDRDTFGEDEITHNIELSSAITYFF